MRNLARKAAVCVMSGVSALMAACGGGSGGTTPPVTTYVLTLNSTTPASGVAITVSPTDNSGATGGTTSFMRTYNSGTPVTLTAAATASGNSFSSWSGCATVNAAVCTVTMSANATVTANYSAPVITTPTVTVTLGSASITTAQALQVTVAVSGSGATPTGSITLSRGSYASAATTLSGGSATINIPAGVLAVGINTLTAAYTPDAASAALYNSASGSNTVTVTAPAKITPTVTVTPASLSITTTQTLSVTVAVNGGSGNATPTGAVVLSSGSYASAVTTLSAGSATIVVPAGSLATGSDTLKASYTPDSPSSSTYNAVTGTSAAVTVTVPSTVTVDQSSTGPKVTDQLLGMNLAAWYDVAANATAINTAFQAAGIKAVRWPGGSWSDDYHWGMNGATPSLCPNSGSTSTWGGWDTFSQFVTTIVQAGGFDLALTANYGDDVTCTKPGDPAEAAAWITAAVSDGIHVSHMTVGNEEYGSWESDHHVLKNDAATYANAVIGANGYYQLIKAADNTTLVGVDVNPGNSPSWDPIVLANAKGSYEFVEYHFYPQGPGLESDTYLVHQAAQDLTNNINTIKSELTVAGIPNTPIYVGEIGSVYTNPGKQSWSITQGLYAGQVLGEMMNAGVVRATWWIGFGNCNGSAGSFSNSLYGWQTFGAYNIFSDGSSDSGCTGAGPIGTMSPTARAFQLFSNVAVTGESVLTPSVTGDTTDVRAYAATHSGATALVLFNLNETASEPVTLTLSKQSASTDVTVITYDKAIYDQTDAVISVWAGPTTLDLGAQSLR